MPFGINSSAQFKKFTVSTRPLLPIIKLFEVYYPSQALLIGLRKDSLTEGVNYR